MFQNRKAILPTMHNKQSVIAPILKKEFGIELFIPTDFNTDKYGTFTREIKRKKSQIETAIQKANDAMDKYNYDLAIASEGSFGPDPVFPLINSNFEIVVLVDRANDLTIVAEFFTNETNFEGNYFKSIKDLEKFCEKIDLPKNGVILRKFKNLPFLIYKDITSTEGLLKKVKFLQNIPPFNSFYVETDMRADRNTLRMKAIQNATSELVRKMKSLCPSCNTPGFSVSKTEGYKECENCSTPSRFPMYEIFECQKCGYSNKKLIGKSKTIEVKFCKICNP